MSDLAIKVENLTKIYKLYDKPVNRLKEAFHPFRKKYHKDFYALNDISFEIKEGEFVSIVGKSGAGKTTLVRLILGLETPTSGEVYFNDINLNNASPSQIQEMRRSIGGVYQDYKLLPKKTVYENVAYIMQVEGKENEEKENEVVLKFP